MSNTTGNVLVGTGAAVRAFLAILSIGTFLAASGTAQAVTPWYAAGSAHTLTLKPDGTVWALGMNSDGQLGIGDFGGQKEEPVQVSGLSGVVAVAAKGAVSVALRKDGTVWAWGKNFEGQLGNGSTISSSIPVQVSGLSGVSAIAAGKSHLVALKNDGSVWAWGSNSSGQLGNESVKFSSTTPVKVSGLHDITAIAAGAFHTAALRSDGTVWAWGANCAGQLGNGSTERSAVPVQVSGLAGVTAIAAGNYHVVALLQDGTARAWGSNYYRQLGVSTSATGSELPVQVSGIAGIADITAKVNHSIALMKDGTVWAWGDEGTGQWGTGVSMAGSGVPVQMRGVSRITTVAAIGNPATVLNQSGTALARADRTQQAGDGEQVSLPGIRVADVSVMGWQ